MAASNLTVEQELRRHIPLNSMKGQGWGAYIKALATALQPLRDQSTAAYDQLFHATAGGKYLDKRMAEEGLERPENVGMEDEAFRELGIALSTGKLTTPSFLALLEIFYGRDATRAHVVSTVAEPFTSLHNQGYSFVVEMDGRDRVTMSFTPADFSATPSALEVAVVVNRAFELHGVRGLAMPWYEGETGATKLGIYSATRGLRGSVQVITDPVFGFPTTKALLQSGSRVAYVKTTGRDQVEVVMPATSVVVARKNGQAAYLEESSAGAGNGPYIYSTSGAPAVTETSTTLTQAIEANHGYRILSVANAAAFPDASGYICIAFGYDYQASPVPYLGRTSSGGLMLDQSYRFAQDIPSGSSVILLAGQGVTTGAAGGFIATPSAAGRVACESILDQMVAGGFEVKRTVVYPGDEGLADVADVFGGDDLDG